MSDAKGSKSDPMHACMHEDALRQNKPWEDIICEADLQIQNVYKLRKTSNGEVRACVIRVHLTVHASRIAGFRRSEA